MSAIHVITRPGFRPDHRGTGGPSVPSIRSYFASGGGWWDLTDNTDASGNGNTLTEVGSPPYEEFDGRPAPCLTLAAASTQYLTINDNAALSMGAGVSFTVGAWAQIASGGGFRTVISKGDRGTAANCEYAIYYNNANRYRFTASDGSSLATVTDTNVSVTPGAGAWSFIVAQFDLAGGKVRIRVNAGGWVEAAFTGPVQNSTQPFRLGNDIIGGTRLWDGNLDGVFVVKTLLSDAEIGQIYNSGFGKTWGSL